MVIKARGVGRRVQILGSIMVDIGQQSIHVTDIESHSGPPRPYQRLIRHTVLEQAVDQLRVLEYLMPVLSLVVPAAGLVLLVLIVSSSPVALCSIHRSELERGIVEEHESSSAGRIDGIKDGPDAVDISGNIRLRTVSARTHSTQT